MTAETEPKNAFKSAAERFVNGHATIQDASRAFKAFLRTNLPLVKKVSAEIHDMAESVLDAAAYDAVTRVQRSRREVIWRTPSHQDATAGDRIVRAGMTITLMDFPMRSGRRLADANGSEVLSDSESYAATAKDATHKAEWLRRIAEAVGDRIVGEVLTDADLRRMRS